jgi:dihydroorotate dehydrogenase (fumarate)
LTPIDSLAPTLAGIIQARTGGLDLSVAASGGVRTAEDAIKAMIAGADVVMVTSEIYRSGAEAIRGIVQGIDRYLELGGYPTLAHFHKVRPVPESRTQQAARQDYLEPLTRSDTYTDPTPVARHQAGDRYGHPA